MHWGPQQSATQPAARCYLFSFGSSIRKGACSSSECDRAAILQDTLTGAITRYYLEGLKPYAVMRSRSG